ncbi:hypothetical protein GCM10023187_18060 [Nibrella viscosa]|uniref:Uncharacterized protein n=2 Tax=Nibrella viscosa TaxID=1084524 RepID=A0ABP8K9Z0_9BACT
MVSVDERTAPVNSNSLVVYQIKAGQHFSQQDALRFTSKTTLTFEATFNESAMYQSREPGNQGDINKLYGFSDCNTHHQTNSARFGWNWTGNALRIYAYCYQNSKVIAQEIGTVNLNETNTYQLAIVGSKYVFRLRNKTVEIPRGCSETATQQRYRLYPYFGGDEPAPHDVTISIKEL